MGNILKSTVALLRVKRLFELVTLPGISLRPTALTEYDEASIVRSDSEDEVPTTMWQNLRAEHLRGLAVCQDNIEGELVVQADNIRRFFLITTDDDTEQRRCYSLDDVEELRRVITDAVSGKPIMAPDELWDLDTGKSVEFKYEVTFPGLTV